LPEQGQTAIDQVLAWKIPTVSADDLIRAGYQQSVRFGCSLNEYDGLYLALAEAAGVLLIYADQRLRHNLADRSSYALSIEDYRSP